MYLNFNENRNYSIMCNDCKLSKSAIFCEGIQLAFFYLYITLHNCGVKHNISIDYRIEYSIITHIS